MRKPDPEGDLIARTQREFSARRIRKQIHEVPRQSLPDLLREAGKKLEWSIAPSRINTFGLRGKIEAVIEYRYRIVDSEPGEEPIQQIDYVPEPVRNKVEFPTDGHPPHNDVP